MNLELCHAITDSSEISIDRLVNTFWLRSGSNIKTSKQGYIPNSNERQLMSDN